MVPPLVQLLVLLVRQAWEEQARKEQAREEQEDRQGWIFRHC